MPGHEQDGAELLDLRGKNCPINYVRSKLYLEKAAPGTVVDIYLDEGDPIKNVPRSLESDGHEILDIENKGDFFRVRVKKGGG